MNLPFFIARRYLVKQKGTFSSFIIKLAIAATALSVAVMILALAVVTGFSGAIREKLYAFMGNVHVSRFDFSRAGMYTPEPVALDRKLIAGIARLPHVVQVAPFVQSPVIVQAHGQLEGIKLKGVDSHYSFAKGITIAGSMISYADTAYAKQVMLSERTATRLNAQMGDTVLLYFVQAGAALPRIRRATIAGLFHSGLEDVDKFYGLCDIRLLQHINGWTADSINAYQADLDNAAYADTVSNYIHYNLTAPPLESYTTESNNSDIFEWLRLQSLNGVILLVIMAVVAVINMGAVLIILMVDRAAMIGLLKALGMPFGSIRSIFTGIAALIAGAGIIAGNALALGLCWLQLRYGLLTLQEDTYSMRYVPVKIVWWHIGVIDAATLLLCMVCVWLPALYIRTIQPARILQFK